MSPGMKRDHCTRLGSDSRSVITVHLANCFYDCHSAVRCTAKFILHQLDVLRERAEVARCSPHSGGTGSAHWTSLSTDGDSEHFLFVTRRVCMYGCGPGASMETNRVYSETLDCILR